MPSEPVEGETPAEALRHYIRAFLSHVVALQSPTWHQILMLREMVNPTGASEALVREAIRPRFERLSGIIRQLCPEADDRRIQALAFSVVGQCLHYKLTRSISERIVGADAFARLDIEYLTDHISRFTLAALGEAPPFDSVTDDIATLSRREKSG
jgi:TetR/AcrR family transcriptional regulator, regulator of cefoperazone and chloramphenicol sensitivity